MKTFQSFSISLELALLLSLESSLGSELSCTLIVLLFAEVREVSLAFHVSFRKLKHLKCVKQELLVVENS